MLAGPHGPCLDLASGKAPAVPRVYYESLAGPRGAANPGESRRFKPRPSARSRPQ